MPPLLPFYYLCHINPYKIMELLRCFYHPYHASTMLSNLWITDGTGQAIQHLHYLPFGEDWVDQRNSSWNTPYTFSGKEKDVETGYGYFGARYYDSGLSVWLSVDPLSDKYPTLSPYTYCANNPIMMVDPDGKRILGIDNKAIGYTKNNDGSITWTSNTTDDVKLLGSIMLQTKVGTFFFDAMKNAKHNITIEIDNTEQIDKGKLGETGNSYIPATSGKDNINPERIRASKITLFQNSIQNSIDSPNGGKRGLPIAVAMASVLVHEAVHATDFENIRDCLMYILFEPADIYNFWNKNKEKKPYHQEKLFLDEYKNLNK